jgi:hypothetical protein
VEGDDVSNGNSDDDDDDDDKEWKALDDNVPK